MLHSGATAVVDMHAMRNGTEWLSEWQCCPCACAAVLGYAAVHFNKLSVDAPLLLKAFALYTLANTAVNLITRKGFGEKARAPAPSTLLSIPISTPCEPAVSVACMDVVNECRRKMLTYQWPHPAGMQRA